LSSIDLSNRDLFAVSEKKESRNAIRRLDNFKNLPNLKFIDVLKNPIISISCLERLPKLIFLYFTFSRELQKKTIEDMIDYIHTTGFGAEYDTDDFVDIFVEKSRILYDTEVKIFGPTKTYTINDFITLKLFNDETRIFVNGKFFMLCKHLLLSFPLAESSLNNGSLLLNANIASTDDAVENYPFLEDGDYLELDSESEFWGHCSNLQVWAENDYNASLIHSNLAFPLLKELVLLNDLKAKKVFKEEIAKKIAS